MQTPTTRYRFIPFRKADIVQMCLRENQPAGHEAGQETDFKQLCHMLDSVFHFEFHQLVESLKHSYAPIDPDADTRSIDQNAPAHEQRRPG